MESRAKLLGHPVHQMLIPFPIGSFGLAVVGDALHSVFGQRRYAETARLALDVGLATALVAAPFGLVDWLGITPRTRAKRVGALHAIGNLAMLGLFVASRRARSSRKPAPADAKWLAGAGFALGGVTAWLGGELVNRHGIGVHDRLGQNAPSSLGSGATRAARERAVTAQPEALGATPRMP